MLLASHQEGASELRPKLAQHDAAACPPEDRLALRQAFDGQAAQDQIEASGHAHGTDGSGSDRKDSLTVDCALAVAGSLSRTGDSCTRALRCSLLEHASMCCKKTIMNMSSGPATC